MAEAIEGEAKGEFHAAAWGVCGLSLRGRAVVGQLPSLLGHQFRVVCLALFQRLHRAHPAKDHVH